MTPKTYLLSVFAAAPGGGNPAPIVLDADGISSEEMRAVAQSYGHESAFVLAPPEGSVCDFRLRFFVPHHEMEMCGHATVGVVWLLRHLGLLRRDRVTIDTLSGTVDARLDNGDVEISQPKGRVTMLADAKVKEILSVLRLDDDALARWPVVNAVTSRVKTLVPLKSPDLLNALRPDFARMEQICERIGSTGLYPFAVSSEVLHTFEARQFPKASGYPEDAATGVAAAALAFGLLQAGAVTEADTIRVLQGRAMGRPSQIGVRFRRGDGGEVTGCWLGGAVQLAD